MKNRILASILSILLVLTGSGAVFAYGDKSENNTGSYMDFLNTIDVFDKTDTADDYTTRAEFAVYLARILNVDEYYREEKIYFSDVPATYWKSNSINSLAELGIISGDGGNMFRPEEYISYDEAACMLIKILGYQGVADMTGGYPKGYRSTASDLKINKGVTTDGTGMTKSAVARMLTNALNTAVAAPNYKSGEMSYSSSDSDTLLYKQKSMRNGRGIVTGIKGLSLTDKSVTKDDEVIISDVVYCADIGYVLPFLGMEVDFYYYDDDDDTLTVVFMSERGKNDILEIAAEDIIAYNGADCELTYSAGSNAKRAQLDVGAEIIFNGSKSVESLTEAINSLKYGKITLYSMGNSSSYKAAVIERYEICRVTMNDTQEEKIYGKYIDGSVIDVGKYQTVRVFAESGAETDIDEIRNDDILTVIRSDTYLEMHISRLTVSGIVEKADDEAAVIDGTEYEINEYLSEKHGLVFRLNEEVSCGIAYDGNIVYTEYLSSNEMRLGYIRYSRYNDDDEVYTFKLFTSDGEFVNADAAKKVKIDGKSYKAENVQYAMYKDKEPYPMLIRYSFNDDGEIDRIDTPSMPKNTGEYETEASLTITGEMGLKTYYNNQCMGPKNVVGDSTRVFMVPTDSEVRGAALSKFSAGGRSLLKDSTEYLAEIYSIGTDKGIDDVVLVKSDSGYSVEESGALFLIERMYTSVNEDDEVIRVIEGYRRLDKVTYTVKDETLGGKTLHKGDLLYVSLDNQNEIRAFSVMYCYEGGTPAEQWGGATVNGWGEWKSRASGYVINIKDGVIKFGYNDTSTISEAYLLKTWPKVVYFDGEKAWVDSSDNIITAEMNPTSPDRIITTSVYASIGNFVIYRTAQK